MAEQPASKPKPRGRPGRKAETPQQRLQRLERDLAAARKAVAEAEQRKLAAVGRAVLEEAESNAAFMAELRRVLRTRITGKAGRAELASLLESPAAALSEGGTVSGTAAASGPAAPER